MVGMTKIVMKMQLEEGEVSAFIKMKDHESEDELDMIKLCLHNLLVQADYTEAEIKSILVD